jgi:hypothetical protein
MNIHSSPSAVEAIKFQSVMPKRGLTTSEGKLSSSFEFCCDRLESISDPTHPE